MAQIVRFRGSNNPLGAAILVAGEFHVYAQGGEWRLSLECKKGDEYWRFELAPAEVSRLFEWTLFGDGKFLGHIRPFALNDDEAEFVLALLNVNDDVPEEHRAVRDRLLERVTSHL